MLTTLRNFTITRSLVLVPIIGALLASTGAAHAERTDRQKPVELEADKVTVDDLKQTQLFEGSVHLTQGSMELRSARLEVVQDSSGFQRGIASGDSKAQAWFKQKRDGRNDYVEGKGDRIEHDNKSEITEFFGKAWVRNGADEVTGPYIRYDAKTQNYQVNSQAAAGKPVPADTGGRVRAVIQPKGDNAPPAPASGVPASPSAPR